MENENSTNNHTPKNEQKNKACCSSGNSSSCACTSGKGLHKILFIFVIVLILVTYIQSRGGKMSEEAAKLWLTDYSNAQQLASENGKPLLISFHIPRCPPCGQMKSEVYSSQQFCDFASENLILLLQDGYKDSKLATKFGFNGFPSFVIQSTNGETLKTFSGYRNTEDFINIISQTIHQ